jgi:hypothetical protein
MIVARRCDMRPIPLKPDWNALAERNVRALVRACIAEGRSKTTDQPLAAGGIVRRLWPDDDTAHLITRASLPPSALASTNALARIAYDFVSAMAPMSAGAALLDAALQFFFERAAYLSVPSFTANASTVAFVGEGTPIPVVQFVAGAVHLQPKKLATITVLTEEMLEASQAAETLVRDVLLRSTALALDTILFDANPADSVRPAGLLNGVTALPASSVVGDPFDAMIKDLSALAAAVSSVGGPICFIASRDRAANMRIRVHYPEFWNEGSFQLLASASVPADVIIAVALDGLVSATDALPQIRASRDATVNMATPALPIVDGGGTPAEPTTSLWQTRCVSLILKFTVDWGLRSPTAVAWIEKVNW